MDKEKEIEEMAKAIRARYSTDCSKNKNITSEIYQEVIKAQNQAFELVIEDFKEHELKYLVEAGYRKADEVRKEAAKEILLYLKATITDGLLKNHEILNALMKEYGVEVDE